MFGHRFPIKVTIYAKRQGGMLKLFDRARAVQTSEGENYFEFFKTKIQRKRLKIDSKDLKVRTVDKKGKMYIDLYSPSLNEYYPLYVDDEDKSLKILPEDLKMFYSYQVRRSYERYNKKGLFDKLLPLIMIIGTCIGVMLIIQVSMQSAVDLAATNHAAAAQFQNATNSMIRAVEIIAARGG